MHKNYDAWNAQKKRLEERPTLPYVHEREIWWCSLGLNIGDEEDGKNELFERPVLILIKYNKRLVLGIPLTSQIKDNPYYFDIGPEPGKNAAILSQIRILSTKRCIRYVRKVNSRMFAALQQSLVAMILNKRTPLARGPRGPSGHL